ncbi:MAG: phosphoribosylformylglycinamidine synthase I [Bacteroidetes bacterium GWC2_33_15]|nr:MAG: phosphoribosylformylglycinamidine synthase I [Bacteroidetes bacterium GWA2_33_15]OFX48982.1 MAG: phosphoribosylformylglycinamidine synthase I [Bacteroidetes bacterium GWC2_33_15]OFX64754.1 MAG: phosphoribosylformylglycinamidine synthase I [Bacteroidetes bacterium GWB2_32_14]OFX68456.1 MAG: phosphoribosylformylglycinamidine synthase I [Bacteroidetes bacterium GWD2_33_33]HAN19180.1 phosphoribosylformylglycinamidine synthase I [Bacteroidales bacterium]
MKFGVVIFPGSNCDMDMIYVLRNIMEQEVVELWHKDTDLQNVDAIVLPGGFSYGDYLRSGAIARYSPIMEKVIEFAHHGGFVFGVCNGFQILCESGLLPGALLHNENQKFICKNVYIIPDNTTNAITHKLDKQKPLKIPIAHGEGRYYASEETLQQMRVNGQILFRYCNQHGEITSEANPNGSIENIAGVCNQKKNVFGMMPHPERASDDELGNTDGYAIFESILSHLIHHK